MEPNTYNNQPQYSRVRIAIAIVVLLLLLGGLIAGGVAIFRAVTKDDAQKPAPITQNEKNAQDTKRNNTPPKPATPAPQNKPTTSPPAPSSTTPPAPTTSANDQKLSSTGPGETIALFVAATFLGTLLHYILARRRAVQ